MTSRPVGQEGHCFLVDGKDETALLPLIKTGISTRARVKSSTLSFTSGVCNLFHWGATFENFNNVEGQSPSDMYKIIKC